MDLIPWFLIGGVICLFLVVGEWLLATLGVDDDHRDAAQRREEPRTWRLR